MYKKAVQWQFYCQRQQLPWVAEQTQQTQVNGKNPHILFNANSGWTVLLFKMFVQFETVSSPGNGARCSNSEPDSTLQLQITLRLSLTAVKETLLEQETFLSLLNPHPRTETPPHHVLPVLLTVSICKRAFFGLLCYSGSQPGCPETTLGNNSFWEGEEDFFLKSFQTQKQSSISNTASLIWLREKKTRQLTSKIH